MESIFDFSALSTLLSALAAVYFIWAAFLLLALMGRFILKVTCLWHIFEKTGEPAWAALVPFYSRYCLYDITWDNGWISLASFIPGVSFVLYIITMVKLSCRFTKNSVFTLGLVLFEPVFLAILAFDDSEYFA